MHVKKAIEYRSMNLEHLTKEEYYHLEDMGMLYVYFPEASGSYDNDMKSISRIDQIGQTGNDGEHYENNWPHINSDSYSDKVKKVVEDVYDCPKDHMMDGDDWDETYISSSYEEPCRGHDMISNPRHYELGNTGVEAIDVIKASLTREEFIGYLRGNILKYQLRSNKKNGIEDLKKADIYSGWLVEVLE